MHPSLGALLVQLALALPAGAVMALVLWRAGLAGSRCSAAVLGAVAAGLMLGPGVLGRMAPGWHAQTFSLGSGGVAAQRELDGLDERYARERLALLESGVTQAALEDLAENRRQRRQGAAIAVDVNRAWHILWTGWMAAGLSVVAVALLALGAPPGRRAPSTDPVRPALVGAVAAVAAGLCASVILVTLAGMRRELALVCGAALACAGVPGLACWRVGAAPAVRTTVAFTACAAAFGLLVVCQWHWRATAWVGTMGALGMCVPWIAARVVDRRGFIKVRRAARCFALRVVVPGAGALTLSACDPSAAADQWVAIALLACVAGDAPMLGAWLTIRALGGSSNTPPLAWAMGLLSSGPGVAAVVLSPAILLLAPGTPGMSVALAAVLASAAVMELVSPALGSAWRMLAK